MNNQFVLTTLPPPKSQTAAVLKLLIEHDGLSERETNYNGFRTRISELKNEHNLDIQTVKVDFVNSFGRKSKYNKHYLNDWDKPEAIELYFKINK